MHVARVSAPPGDATHVLLLTGEVRAADALVRLQRLEPGVPPLTLCLCLEHVCAKQPPTSEDFLRAHDRLVRAISFALNEPLRSELPAEYCLAVLTCHQVTADVAGRLPARTFAVRTKELLGPEVARLLDMHSMAL